MGREIFVREDLRFASVNSALLASRNAKDREFSSAKFSVVCFLLRLLRP